VEKMAEKDRITVLCTGMEVDKIVSTLREQEW
jgi:putative transcriptional regulator